MLNEKLNMNIRYPEMPKIRETYFNIDKLSEYEIFKLQKKKAILTDDKKQYLLNTPNKSFKFMNSIKRRFKERYDKDYSLEEIKTMFNY